MAQAKKTLLLKFHCPSRGFSFLPPPNISYIYQSTNMITLQMEAFNPPNLEFHQRIEENANLQSNIT
jgi:hypothetical protein